MTFARLQDTARQALAAGAALGFDTLSVTASAKSLVGVRFVQGAVCRENVQRDDQGFTVTATWQGREAHLDCPKAGLDELKARLRQLRDDIERQSPDQEFVSAIAATGSLTWDVARGDFAELYGPESLYPVLEKHAARARRQGLRVTGYLEAQELHEHAFRATAGGPLDLRTRDHGLTLSLTVDDPRTGAVGATRRAAVHAPPAVLDQLLGEALDEAMGTCTTSAKPGELAPGDYTAVFHPAAVSDLLSTTMAYGLFDRRKVDEQRTYLSGKVPTLTFPAGLHLSQTLSLPLPGGGTYADLPLNRRGVPCASLDLIDGGLIRDLHCTPFWAQRVGAAETFSAGWAPPMRLAARPHSPLHGQHRDLAALIASTERGVYVANTWYLRMVAEMDGIITGMTRDGLYEIKDGKLAGPLLNMRWHDNPLRMLAAVSAVADNPMLMGRARLTGGNRTALAAAAAIKVEGFHFSSVTRF